MTTSPKGIAVVTGASSGIGAIYADRLARRGYDLILVARSQSKLDEVAKRIAGATGRSVRAVAADLNDKADLQADRDAARAPIPASRCWSTMPGVGALVSLLESDVDDMEAMIELNVTALTRLTYAVVPAFVARGGGTIINISSAVAIAPELLNGVYGGTKAFVLAFSLSLHKELADRNIRIQAVLPGATATNFWDAAGGSVDHLPSEMVMQTDDLVDAALAGFDQGEFVTIPSLPDAADWHAYEAARQKLIPNLSLSALAGALPHRRRSVARGWPHERQPERNRPLTQHSASEQKPPSEPQRARGRHEARSRRHPRFGCRSRQALLRRPGLEARRRLRRRRHVSGRAVHASGLAELDPLRQGRHVGRAGLGTGTLPRRVGHRGGARRARRPRR